MKALLLRVAICAAAFGVADGAWAFGNKPPALVSFTVVEIDAGVYALEGQVADEYPDESIVWFGGALEGYYAFCDSEGGFFLAVNLTPYETGRVYAQAFDNIDQASNVLYDTIL
jgi:hypothetical protein